MKKLWVVVLLCGGSMCSAQVPLRGEILASPGTNYSELSVEVGRWAQRAQHNTSWSNQTGGSRVT